MADISQDAHTRSPVDDDSSAGGAAVSGPGLEVIPDRWRFLSLLAAWQAALLTALLIESHRLKLRLLEQGTPGSWGDAPAWDGTWFVPLLLLAPFCWGCVVTGPLLPRWWKQWHEWWVSPGWLVMSVTGLGRSRWTASLLIGTASLAAGEISLRLPVLQTVPQTVSVQPIRDVLPLVQDEFSYLLQTRGLLAGRWWWPGPDRAPELFHQLHVLNEGRFGSRYFPGTGLWTAPWLALGHPEWAPRAAGALISIGMFWIGRELAGTAAGWIAGLLTALAPGMAIFNHLCLAHQPGLVGLVLFLFFFLRLMKTGGMREAFLAGSGLSFAMLCRPLTAAAIGLPFGIWLLTHAVQTMRSSSTSSPDAGRCILRIVAGLGIPLCLGLALLAGQNVSLTGSPFVTPYQRYTELYTPRHAFGFHQTTEDAVPQAASRQLQISYNNWAEELDLPRAVSNSILRWRGSLSWGLGLIPLLMTLIVMLGTFSRQSRPVQLVIASICCLHLAHVPYWLTGMLEHHYVFEADLLCLLLLAVCSVQLLRVACRQGRIAFPGWWACLIGASICLNWVGIGPRGESRIATGWHSFLQATAGYRKFEKTLQRQSLSTPALVLITPAADDLHVQFVRNLPPFDAEILTGIFRPDLYSIEALAALFPERTLYHYDSATGRFVKAALPLVAVPGETRSEADR